jgi:succinoglycan biosynthesis protein ExoM
VPTADPVPAATTAVTVAVLTYRRNAELAALLPTLVAELRACGFPGRVLVVDNDPGAGAREVVEEYGWEELHYVWEAEPGIAAARNRAMAESEDDVLVFIDDDERPVTGWLGLLLAAYTRSRASAVVGPVVSEFVGEPSDFVIAGGFFDRRRMPTGSRVSVAASNNLLLDLAVVRRLGLTFDRRFGLTGGSDYLFTRQLHLAGEVLEWCDEAVVVDVVPPERSRPGWVLRRAFRSGNSSAVIEIDLAAPGWARARVKAQQLAAGLVRVLGGLVKCCAGAVSGSLRLRAHGARNLARGAGLLAGAAGIVYGEYHRPKNEPATVSR